MPGVRLLEVPRLVPSLERGVRISGWRIESDPVVDVVIVGRMPVIFGLGAGLAVVSATLKFTGGSLAGSRDPNVDHYAQKVAMRENRRRPIEETLAEVGEGRCERFSPLGPK